MFSLLCCLYILIPFWPISPFYTPPPKTLENQSFSGVFKGYKVGTLARRNRLRTVSFVLATGKVALIIANKDYDFPQNEQLMHPVNDAKLLSEKLKEIGFNVFCFVNLNKREMELAINAYCNVLKSTPGMYSVFYFCGHGIEEHGMTFLLPTDVPEEWNADSAISDTYVRYKIQECSTTRFDLFLLDVCRIR